MPWGQHFCGQRMAAGERGGRGGEDRGEGMKGKFRRWKRGGHLVGHALFCFKLKGGDELGLQASGCTVVHTGCC